MKKTLHIPALILLTLAVSSCEDQLDLLPVSQTIVGESGQGTAGSSIKDAASAESALAGCYAIFKSGSAEYYVLDYFLIGDGQSDNSYAGADNASWFEVDEFRILSTNGAAARDWTYLYNHIARANSIIANVPKVTDPSLTENRKNQIVGEAKFMRARAYFDLVRIYGAVPLVVDELPTITSENVSEIYALLYPARATTEEIYTQILKDLDEAAPVVPASGPDKMTITPGAVHTLLAKVHATLGNWEAVLSHTATVTGLGYQLLADFGHLWDGQHENSSEAIFELNFSDWATGGNWGSSMFYGTDWKKFNTPSNDLIAAYDAEGDAVRKAATIFFADVTGKWSDRYHPLTRFPFAYKMRRTDASENVIVYRLADVLLLRAEALNETGDAAAARALVNQVRSRVGLAPATASDQASLRLAIEKERRLELAFEGHRWFDLLRTGRAIEVMKAVKDGNGAGLNYGITETSLIWPVPQGEIDKNENLEQNPGY